MEFVQDRPFAKPEKAARKLLEIILRGDIDAGQYAYTGATNSAFMREGGNVTEYASGMAFGTVHGWFDVDRSGTRIYLLKAGCEL